MILSDPCAPRHCKLQTDDVTEKRDGDLVIQIVFERHEVNNPRALRPGYQPLAPAAAQGGAETALESPLPPRKP